MPALHPDSVELLKSPNQRVRLYVAKFPPFQLRVSTNKKDPVEIRRMRKAKWRPVINVGPHRMCFLGEGLRFDARDSFHYAFSGKKSSKNEERQNRATGYGKGSDLLDLTWTITHLQHPDETAVNGTIGTVVLTRNERPWDEEFFWKPQAAGLYRLDVDVPDLDRDEVGLREGEEFASRWIQVYPDRDHMPWSVTQVDTVTGEWGGGYACSLTLQNDNIEIRTTGFGDFTGIGIYAEEFFGDNGGGWTCRPMGPVRHDPRLVMLGYVKDGTIVGDWQSRAVRIEVESIVGQMERSQAHKVAIWNGQGPDVEDDESDKVDAGLETDQRKQARKKDDNNTDGWGAILEGFRKVCVTDFAMYLLQRKTNLLQWHDFWAMWTDELADLESVAGEEASILSNLQTVAENDWMLVGADCSNAIVFGPDRQVTRDVVTGWDAMGNPTRASQGWEELWPVTMRLTPHHILELDVQQNLEKNYKYVKLVATKTTDVAAVVDPGTDKKARRTKKKARREAQHQQKIGWWPTEEPTPNASGQWFVKQNLLHDSERTMRQRAYDVFQYINLKWSGTVTLPLNRAFRAGDYVAIQINAQGEWSVKKFLVKQVSYETDLEASTWKTSLQIEEAVDDLNEAEQPADPWRDPYREE